MTETISLRDAMVDQSRTANGALTNATSLNRNVDLFFLAGASRGKDIRGAFAEAYAEDPEIATRILLWTRDVRAGAGERDQFRNLFREVISKDIDLARRVLAIVPELGRWDDVLVAFGTGLERDALQMIAKALVTDQNGLCAKWMPRPGKDGANKIRAYLRLTPKNYRQLLVGLSKTVEQKMCADRWTEIEYKKVPSLAAARYQKAFTRHDPTGYGVYRSALERGETTINAGAVYPYDVLKSLRFGDQIVSEAQWAALPDYLNGSTEAILPVVDVSGSMHSSAGGNKNVSCLDVALSLGLYLSERSKGIYQDTFCTFSAIPELIAVKGSLRERMESMSKSKWGMNTNIQAVFERLLEAAIQFSVPESGMPTKILILSDMEFDECVVVGSNKKHEEGPMWGMSPAAEEKDVVSAMKMIEDQYTRAGYQLPQLIFWNLNGRSGNIPVKYNKAGTALVSGFSPAIMTSLLGGADLTPESIMLKTVMQDRYTV